MENIFREVFRGLGWELLDRIRESANAELAMPNLKKEY